MSKTDRWLIVPFTKDRPSNELEPQKLPKYVDKIDSYQSKAIPNEDKALVLFEGTEQVLDDISDNDDVKELNEVEAQKLFQKIERQKDEEEEEDFQPISRGEGDTSEERLQDVISKLEEGMTIGDEGVTVADPAMTVGYRIFLNQPVITLDYSDIVELPRQLSDLILKPPASVISNEQREFLIAIPDLTQYAMNETETYDGFSGDLESQGPGFKDLMLNYRVMMDYTMIPDRMGDADNRVREFISSYTGLSGPNNILIPFSLFGPTSLAMLDGFIKYRCEDIGINEGNYRDGEIEMSWRPDSPSKSSMTFHDRLQYWRTYVANDKVKSALDKINNLSRYNADNLRNIAGIMGNEDILERELESTKHFLAILSEQRNYSIHGQGSSRVIAPLALNLCSMVLLDKLGSDRYGKIVEEYLIKQRR